MTYTGSISDLREMRAAWRKMTEAAAAWAALGEGFQSDAYRMSSEARRLGEAQFTVIVPCLIGGEDLPISVGVGEEGSPEPNTGICGACNERAEEGMAALEAARKAGEGS
jgi:hypothetical protein